MLHHDTTSRQWHTQLGIMVECVLTHWKLTIAPKHLGPNQSCRWLQALHLQLPPFGTPAIAPLPLGLLLATKSTLVTLTALQNDHSPSAPSFVRYWLPISPVGLNSSYHRSSGFSEPPVACLSWPSHFPAPLWQLPGIISQKKYSCPLNTQVCTAWVHLQGFSNNNLRCFQSGWESGDAGPTVCTGPRHFT